MLPPTPDRDPKRPTPARLIILIAVAGIGAYFVISGIVGLLTPG